MRKDKVLIVFLLTSLLILAMAYAYGILTQFDEMKKRPVRIAYLVSDLIVVFPLGIATIAGFLLKKRWSKSMQLLTAGALVFDMIHQTIYLMQDNYFKINLILPVSFSIILVIYAILVFYYSME